MMALAMHVEQVAIEADAIAMEGLLWLPDDHLGVVLFAGDVRASRVRPPNDYVACVLRDARLGTLWLDPLTPQEARDRDKRADVGLLARRLTAACDWLRRYPATMDLPVGVFCASHGAAAAMQLAAERGSGIVAIVSRGGRHDPVEQGDLAKISAPTLLIVGSLDDGGIDQSRAAYAALRCKKRFEIIPGATHSFEEPGSMEVVARLARGWFLRYSSW